MKYKVLKQILTPSWSFEVGQEVDGNKLLFALDIKPEKYPEWFELIPDLEDFKREVQQSKNYMEYYTAEYSRLKAELDERTRTNNE